VLRNPFRSEGAAFRFLLLTLVAFAAVGVAAIVGGPWAGVPTWAAVSAAAVAVYARRGRPTRPLRTAPAHVGPPEERRLLVLAEEALPAASIEEIGRRADRVLVVSPVVASPVRHWVSDVDEAREEASRRVDVTVERLRAASIEAAGTLGDEDPVTAIEDALRTFGGDEIVVATPPSAGGDAVVARVRERFALPVTHLVA
jgi:hypothetical protein